MTEYLIRVLKKYCCVYENACIKDLLQSTRRPFKSMDLALSREVNRQGQRNRAIYCHFIVSGDFKQFTINFA